MTLGRIHLTPQLVQAVRDAVDILDVASEHTQLKKNGNRHQGLCPLHKEKTPSFSVDAVQGLYYCFGCGAGGDAIKLHMQITGDDFPAAVESLARRYGIRLPTAPRRGAKGTPEPDTEGALEAACEYFTSQLEREKTPGDYLSERRISPELVRRFELGYAKPGWKGLVEALHPRIPLADLIAAGLVLTSQKGDRQPFDRFRHRLMFPIRSPSGRLVGFGGRTLGDDRAKYLNTNETERFKKGQLLYGMHLARRSIREEGRVLLVEGYFDVLAAAASGIDWAVASMGTALRTEQARLLARYTDEVVLGYDGDRAGEEASRKALSILLAEGLGVRRARFPAGGDPDSVRLETGEKAVVEIVESARESVALELERLIPPGLQGDPHKKAQMAKQVRELLLPVRDPVVRYGHGRLAAERLGVPPELLWRGRSDAGLPGSPPRIPGESLVLTTEERTLQLLLAPGAHIPPPSDLPPAEVFLDSACRNIFATFCDLYRSEGAGGADRKPDLKAVLAELPVAGEAIDRIARVLLQEPAHSGAGELESCVNRLRKRWQHQRLRQLAQEIKQAEQAGEVRLLERLLKEKTAVSRNLHRLP